MTINKRLKELRKTLKITQKEMAQRLSVRQSYYSDIENERRSLSPKFLDTLVAVCRVSKDWMYTGKGNMFTLKEGNLLYPNDVPSSVPMEAKVAETGKAYLLSIQYSQRLSKEMEKEFADLYNLRTKIFIVSNFQHFIADLDSNYLNELWGFGITKNNFNDDKLTYKIFKQEYIELLKKFKSMEVIIEKLSAAILQFYADFKPFDSKGIVEDHFDTGGSESKA